jgi:predicted TIM-barrel enzyme
LADALIVTGSATGSEVNIDDVRKVKTAVPEGAIFVGSGVTEENLETALRSADGAIIGTALKKNGETSNEVDAVRVKKIVDKRLKCLI